MDFVSHQPVRLTVDSFRRFLVWCLHKTPDFAFLLVHLIAQVLDAVLALDFQILHVGAGDIIGLCPRHVPMYVQE